MNGYYEYRHTVESEETDLAGHAFDVSYVRWQGRCLEMFLLEYAPGTLDELREDLRLVTIAADSEVCAPVRAADELSVRMRLADMTRTQITVAFDYVRLAAGGGRTPVGTVVATGRQLLACTRAGGGIPVPDELRLALAGCPVPEPYRLRSVQAGTGGRA